MQAANEFKDPSQADELDRLLRRMPGEPPSNDLAARICQQIRVNKRRAQRLRLGLSLLLAIFGIWLALPDLISNAEILSLPASGISYLDLLVQSFLSGLWGFTQNALNGLSAFHAHLAQTMGAGAWLGMVALAGAALLALSLVAPQFEE